jgi:TRAP transporter TAXI family solute receptor
MKIFARGLFFAIVCILGAVSIPSARVQAAENIVTVGTAGVTGVYYPAGGAICRLVNRNRREHGLRCVVESTGGSINNLESLRSGDLNMGIVQSDWLYHAYKGSEVFSDAGADSRLRVLFALHSEPFTVVVNKNSGIKSFADLKGKRVYMGNQGSGMRATMEELMRLKGWNKNAFAPVADVTMQNQAQALCDKKVDAIIYAVGHPNGAIQQITSLCPTRIVGVAGPEVDTLIKQSPFYSHTVIPGGMYLNNPDPVKTFGVRAVLVATQDMSNDVAYEFVRGVFDNLDNFKTLHPVFSALEVNGMTHDAENIAPMHDGAKRYFVEHKLLEK